MTSSLVNFGDRTAITVASLQTDVTTRVGATYADDAVTRSLREMRDRIVDNAQKAGPAVTWAEYHARPLAYAGRRVTVRNADFVRGTLRVQQPCVLVVEEDIVFNPRPDTDHRPNGDDAEYAGAPYHLGFFAAVTIECDDVVVLLGHHEITQSREHFVKQRFYQTIELANQPFMPGQGPAQFGSTPRYARRVAVCDGTIGISSHESVHGNMNEDILLENLTIRDYEIAGVALNGVRRFSAVRCHALGNLKSVALRATFSGARFASLFADAAIQHAPSGVDTRALVAANKRLRVLMEQAAGDVYKSDRVDPVAHPEAAALFANRDPTASDGNGYGFLVNPVGVAVLSFLPDRQTAKALGSCDVSLKECSVTDTRHNVTEHTALFSATTGLQRGPTSESFLIRDVVDPVTGRYRANALADLQLQLAEFLDHVPASQRARFGGTTTIDRAVRNWALRAQPPSIAALFASGEYTTKGNGDFMFHVMKGPVAVRIEGVTRACITDMTINGVVNTGARGQTGALPGQTAPVVYTGPRDGGHPDQRAQRGYNGADVRGLSLAGCKDVRVRGLRVSGVHSAAGSAMAIDVHGGSECIEIDDVSIDDVSTDGREYELAQPVAQSVHVSRNCKHVLLRIDDVPESAPIVIESTNNVRLGGA